jgi:hypothetical protein
VPSLFLDNASAGVLSTPGVCGWLKFGHHACIALRKYMHLSKWYVLALSTSTSTTVQRMRTCCMLHINCSYTVFHSDIAVKRLSTALMFQVCIIVASAISYLAIKMTRGPISIRLE